MELTVDEEFAGLLSTGTPLENELLEADLVKGKGPRDPLVVWEGTNILVDGHRRYRICQKHDLPYSIRFQQFADRESVREWILLHQLERRSLSEHERRIAIARYSEILDATSKYGDGPVSLQVARKVGCGVRTVYRNNDYADAFRRLIPSWQGEIAGTVGFTVKFVQAISELSHEEQYQRFEEYQRIVNAADSYGVRQRYCNSVVKECFEKNKEHKLPELRVTDDDLLKIDLPPMIGEPEAGGRKRSREVVVEKIGEALKSLDQLRKQLIELGGRSYIDSDEFRKRIFDAVNIIHRELDWQRDYRQRRVDD